MSPCCVRITLRASLVAVALLSGSHDVAEAQTPAYRLHQVAEFFSPATDIDDNGTVVGAWMGPPVTSDPDSTSRGYRWTLQTGAQPLITDPGLVARFPLYEGFNNPRSRLRLSASGLVTGTVLCPTMCGSRDRAAAAWSSADGLLLLGSFDEGLQDSRPAGVNDLDQIIGYSFGGGFNNIGPFLWTRADGLRPLTGNVGPAGVATGINNLGAVIGSHYTPDATGFLWTAADAAIDLPHPAGGYITEPLALNNANAVIGRYAVSDGAGGVIWHVFRWSAETGSQDIEAPEGFPETMDINDAGDIVVTILRPSIGPVPYIRRNGVWTDLNVLMVAGTGFTLQYVTAINNHGWIVGVGTMNAPTQLGQGWVLEPENSAPSASNESIETWEDLAVTGQLQATDSDGDAVTYALVANGTRGTAVITDASTGAFTYTPQPNANGSDTFTFQASDGRSASASATVTVTIRPINDAPVASNGVLAVAAGASASGMLVGNDIDGPLLTFQIGANGAKGSATITNPATGAFAYTAAANATGTDVFTFLVTDGMLASELATVTVTIQPPSCAVNVTSRVTVQLSDLQFQRKTGHYLQRVTLKNASSASIVGPMAFVLDGLTAGTTVIGAAGRTTCAPPVGSPYVLVYLGSDDVFSRKERLRSTLDFTLEFANGQTPAISFVPRILAGPGIR
jgi:VCBS repeat-containing protein